ncbi:N-acetyltransferase family protein [Tepidamorphus sp. 3E244]|uniref:GNAT family N-acetyltransferase n=1 Tax=Tepidamorphus sp. 3E244 TaxID=3385498 RepID=UPI0038FC056B
MTPDNSSLLRLAQASDLDTLVDMVERFNIEDGHPLENPVREALATLIDDASYGAAFMIGQEEAGAPIGYAVLCHGFSIEFGGRDTILDEVWLVPEARGRGLGKRVLQELYDWSRENGFLAIHLEVMGDNPAMEIYLRDGFIDRGSRFMSKRLT